MPRKKKQRGRPLERGYPPRIDATPEEIAKAFFRKSSAAKPVEPGKTYRCTSCKKPVTYPAVLYRDGRCESCTKAPVK